MKKALLVIDMQEYYIPSPAYRQMGKKSHKMFRYDREILLPEINRAISEYDTEMVIYIRNVKRDTFPDRFADRKVYEGSEGSQLTEGLTIVNDRHMIKWRADAFTNPELPKLLRSKGVTEVECVGIDGAACVPMTARGALDHGLRVILRNSAIGTINEAKRQQWNAKLKETGAGNILFYEN